MVKALKQAAQNFFKFRSDVKRIENEINTEGIVNYVQKHYGIEQSTNKTLKVKHG